MVAPFRSLLITTVAIYFSSNSNTHLKICLASTAKIMIILWLGYLKNSFRGVQLIYLFFESPYSIRFQGSCSYYSTSVSKASLIHFCSSPCIVGDESHTLLSNGLIPANLGSLVKSLMFVSSQIKTLFYCVFLLENELLLSQELIYQSSNFTLFPISSQSSRAVRPVLSAFCRSCVLQPGYSTMFST